MSIPREPRLNSGKAVQSIKFIILTIVSIQFSSAMYIHTIAQPNFRTFSPCRRKLYTWSNNLSSPGSSLLVQTVKKNLAVMWETQVQSRGQEDPLEKGMATHSSILAWRIPWTEEPGGLQTVPGVSKSWTPGVSNKCIFFSPSPWQTTSYLLICHLTTVNTLYSWNSTVFVFLSLLISLKIISSFIHLVASIQSQFPSFIFF